MLGPPKTAFSSAAGARNVPKIFNSTHRPGFGPTDEDPANNEKHPPKDRFSRDGHNIRKDADRPREIRPGNSHNRRVTKDDNESWSTARPQKVLSHDDVERGHRRNGERDQDKEKENGRESRVQQGFENRRRDRDWEGGNGENTMRQNGPGKGRYEPSWYREEDQQGDRQEDREERVYVEGDKDTTKLRDWRDKDKGGTRVGDRDWNKTNKPEQDPEWMDNPASEEKTQAHTQEDFERWKEKMRANNGPVQDLPLSSPEQRPNHERTVSNVSTRTSKKNKVETPLVVDPSFDNFFGLWSEHNKEDSKQGIEENFSDKVAKNNTPKPSKFTGFFSAKPTAESELSEPPMPVPPGALNDSSNEDKEGFQRILKLLDQQQQPHAARNGNSTREIPIRAEPHSPPAQPPRSREPNGLESLLGSQLPKDGAVPQNRDSEFLLKLMQKTQQTRPNLNHANSADQRLGGGSAPGLIPFSNLIGSSRDMSHSTPAAAPQPGFVNESVREDPPPRDKLNPNASLERKGLPPGFLESSTPGPIQRNANMGVLHHSAIPPGLQRPPGLEPNSSAYGQNAQSLRQNMVPPPPGFQGPLRNHNQFPPGLMPNIPNSNSLNERGPLSYGMRPIPPTGMPPPGFMGINPQPPGFPPVSFNQDGRMSPTGRVFFGVGPQRQGSNGFGEAANFGMGGQGMLPGQYRRPE